MIFVRRVKSEHLRPGEVVPPAQNNTTKPGDSKQPVFPYLTYSAPAPSFAHTSPVGQPLVVLGVQNLREIPRFDGGKHRLEAFALDGATGDASIDFSSAEFIGTIASSWAIANNFTFDVT